jgi:chromosome segregation ATPase
MENERFQELVLNHLATLTQEITELKGGQQRMESRMENMESRMENMESRMENMESRMKNIELKMGTLESKMDIANTQIAELIEFKTDATKKLERLICDVEFVKHKEHLNEEELFILKSRLQVVK